MDNKNYTTLRPWYGVWPPKNYIKGNRQNMSDKKIWQNFIVISGLMILVGIIFLLISYILKNSWNFTHDFGVAFIVAGILAMTVDGVLSHQVAENAFKASIGIYCPTN